MPKVLIKAFVHLRKDFNTRQVTITVEEGATIEEVLRKFGERYRVSNAIFESATGELSTHILLSLNGIAVSQLSEGLHTKVKDGDVIALLPVVCGGR